MTKEKMISNQDSNTPIVMVHGFWDTCNVFNRMASVLKNQRKIVYHGLTLQPNNGTVSIEKMAEQLKEYIDSHLGKEQKIILIGFSMGGLVSRYYLQYLGGLARTEKLITISTPHKGTYTAYALNRIACVEMRPNSLFLEKINRDLHLLEQISFTSIWTKYDTTIIPNNSSQLSVGTTIKLPFGIHPLMPFSSKVIQLVSDAIDQ